ncbi:MAG: hypothetical protein K0R21_1278 [Anaerocolumna sp.]|jgi:hypothetical protein|nr:hypothetical protein [Anaerocolumna sp.]
MREINQVLEKDKGFRVKENIEKERLPQCDSFTPYYLWQYGRTTCDMQWV